jgi:ribosomal protein L7/L12
MYDLKALNCPNCGAPLDLESYTTLALCLHCRSRVILSRAESGGVTGRLDTNVADYATFQALLNALKPRVPQLAARIAQAEEAVEIKREELTLRVLNDPALRQRMSVPWWRREDAPKRVGIALILTVVLILLPLSFIVSLRDINAVGNEVNTPLFRPFMSSFATMCCLGSFSVLLLAVGLLLLYTRLPSPKPRQEDIAAWIQPLEQSELAPLLAKVQDLTGEMNRLKQSIDYCEKEMTQSASRALDSSPFGATAQPAVTTPSAVTGDDVYEVLLVRGGSDEPRLVETIAQVTGRSLQEAMRSISDAPCVVAAGLSLEQARNLRASLQQAGATTRIQRI